MQQEESVTTDPLFVGLTRPTMVFGVQFEAFVINGMFTAVVFLATGNPLYLAIGLPVHGIAYAISLNEPRAFSLFFLWLMSKSKCQNRGYWKVNSYSPFGE